MANEGQGADHSAWTTSVTRIGQLGLNDAKALDVLDPAELAYMTNVHHMGGGETSVRPGTSAFASGPSALVHSMRRFEEPQSGAITRAWGIGTKFYMGVSGALPEIDAGYSGNPLSLVPTGSKLTGLSWMLIGDSSRMRRVNAAATLCLPIGLPVPASVTTALTALNTTGICAFDASDATAWANWVPTAGVDRSTPTPFASGVGTGADVLGLSGNCVAFTTTPGAAQLGYYNLFGRQKAMDLSKLQGGTIDATDDDLVHFWMKISDPVGLEEVRIYLVCSGVCNVSVVPGTSETENLDAFVKTISVSDLAAYVDVLESGINAATRAAQRRAIQDILQNKYAAGLIDETTGQPVEVPAEADDSRSDTLQPAPGRQWTEFGISGAPVRRGDFRRIGGDSSRGWATITGIILVIQTSNKSIITISFDDFFLMGGSGPDASEPGPNITKYDVRATNYDPRTGAESNPSAEQLPAAFLSPMRQSINANTPVYAADPAIRQRFYVRGGTATQDWYYAGVSAANGGIFIITQTDEALITAPTLQLDHYQPVPTVNSAGTTVLAQPVRALWGPVNGVTLACGDPYRPGHLYRSKVGEPDHWAADGHEEVCSASEELMNGCVYGEQSYCFSRERLYVNYIDLQNGALKSTPTACRKGLAGYWAFVVTPYGIVFVSSDGIWITTGGEPVLISQPLQPLFEGRAAFGDLAIDLTASTQLRLEYHAHDLWFCYQDSGGTRRVKVYSFLYKYWRTVTYPWLIVAPFHNEHTIAGPQLILGTTVGTAYLEDPAVFSDAGTAIAYQMRTGAWDAGAPRQDKLFGDLILDADLKGGTLSIQARLNNDTVADTAQTIVGSVGRARYTFEPFGQTPQQARNLSLDLTGDSPLTARPVFYLLGVSTVVQPDVSYNRATTWDDLGIPTEKYLMGVSIDADTYGTARTILVEYDIDGTVYTAATLTVTHDGRRKMAYSWPVVKAQHVRLRPMGTCEPWILYKAEWIAQPEPPRIAAWDVNWTTQWDSYYTGLDIECDTFGQDKSVEVYVDQVLIGTYTVNRTGRGVSHITLTPGRGHTYRFCATDAHRGLLYGYRWWLDPEPSEQANWNQNYTVAGALTDKWLKGVLLECDTFNLAKSVDVEIDGVVVETLAVTQDGRGLQEFSFVQAKGRVFRLLPTDANPGRLYSMQWIFDKEPLSMTRYETQEIDHGIVGWKSLLYAHITVRSTADIELIVVTQINQTGTTTTDVYTLLSTAGAKRPLYVPFVARKGVLAKYTFVSDDPFALYREESEVWVQPWGSDQAVRTHPFGNDDLDAGREMGVAGPSNATTQPVVGA